MKVEDFIDATPLLRLAAATGDPNEIGRDDIVQLLKERDTDKDPSTLCRAEADVLLKEQGIPEPARRLILLQGYGLFGNKLSPDELMSKAISASDSSGKIAGVRVRR